MVRGSQVCPLLLQGDALDAARALRTASFDLIYCDPPFFSGRTHRTAAVGFDDRWCGDLHGYLAWLMPRLEEMYRLLKPTGSLFLHLDWHAVHAVKVAMDRRVGRERFVNEVIWSYRTGGTGGRWLARKHDTLLFYARGTDYKFHALRERSDLRHKYGFANAQVRVDERGPYRMTRMRDVWEISALRGNSPERVSYPTQKPLALLERIIALTTDPGDLVGDLLCGSGTTLVAAQRLGRRAIGADHNPEALDLATQRLREGLVSANPGQVGPALTDDEIAPAAPT